MPSNIAVLIPSYQARLDQAGLDSLEAADRHLGKYDWITFGPARRFIKHGARHLDTPDFYWNTGPDGRRGYNPLMCARGLYQQLTDYSHVLVYQPDAIVFRDDLAKFTEWDYIGAPHDRSFDYPRGGNGGLSLRRVEAMLEVLDGTVEWPTIDSYYRHIGMNEDLFWSGVAGVHAASYDASLRFAWETDPVWWWLAYGRELPMGAHGYERHDPEFWENLGGVRSLAGLPALP